MIDCEKLKNILVNEITICGEVNVYTFQRKDIFDNTCDYIAISVHTMVFDYERKYSYTHHDIDFYNGLENYTGHIAYKFAWHYTEYIHSHFIAMSIKSIDENIWKISEGERKWKE